MFYEFKKYYKTDPLFRALEGCNGVEQSKEWHPEGDVLNHSLQVLCHAFRESRDIDLIVAAMVHDIGKMVDSKLHEKYAIKILGDSISEKTSWLIMNHMRFWYYQLGTMKKKKKVHELVTHPWFTELSILGRWDKCGRNPNRKVKYDRAEITERFIKLSDEESFSNY